MDLTNRAGNVIFSADVSTTKELVMAAIKVNADLQYANLRGANLQGAYLPGANLRGANLLGADLRGANLLGADLRYADLQGAYLQGADLRYADLQGAYLRDAKNIPEITEAETRILPEGILIGWKKCQNNVIVKVMIPQHAKRSNATGRKCRASEVKVLQVFGAIEGISQHNANVVYRKGETVKCDVWDADRWNECSGGIHFFLTRIEAEKL